MNNMDNHTLQDYGWNEYWEQVFSLQPPTIRQLSPARVVAQFSHSYRVKTDAGEYSAGVSGKFEFYATKRGDYPAVGDWVAVETLPNERRAVIHAVLPRRTAMVRKAAGNTLDEQIVGANLDDLFIVNSLNQDFNLRKIERYLIAAWESGARPVVLLTKADLCEQPERFAAEVEQIAPGVPVHFVSALKEQGIEALEPYLQAGRTIGVTGSSGVGKSTLLNRLAGEPLQQTQHIREEDARGRHTTTHRELFLLKSGVLVMDTPGMRELQLWDSNEGWHHAFADIEQLSLQCKYRDCKHESDPGCAVHEALLAGTLDAKRLANYKKTARELSHLARKEMTAASKAVKKTNRPKSGKALSRPNKRVYMYDGDE
ncbi:ribosome small subunit-dependent GTPase A [Cohnella terricola]|uniref:Small ribosomal subunit biogenesis GTPase RsgA n=1 Tax=Cohnella terricola TaxID=1289167 RepID=A0A559J5Z8_9BACL|nr:ribosome small subunit-dependent GTPase A [Cohnella terricola]TVX95308.1 ribosome small subunit-dependent GTPase A [Cohnella terricola]